MQAPTKEQLKERAKHLRQIMMEMYDLKVSNGHSLEIISKLFGFKNWNTASALLDKPDKSSSMNSKLGNKDSDKMPVAAKFQTVGEIMEFFSAFDRDTKLFVNEYSWSEPNSNDLLAGNITSVCSLTFDNEIQKKSELVLELNTESEHNDGVVGGSVSGSSTQAFDRTQGGRLQRRIKCMHMLKGFWNPKTAFDNSRPNS